MKKVSITYTYDGTIEGLLTIIYDILKSKEMPINVTSETNYRPNLFDQKMYIKTNLDKSKTIFELIPKKISPLALYEVYNTFLSNNEKKELIILYYLVNGFKYGKKIDNLRNLNCVLKIQKVSKHVRMEAHHLKGFLRFKEINNHILYAVMAPDNDILEILSNHFKRRLKNEKWIIEDEKRGKLSLYDGTNYLIVDSTDFDKSKIISTIDEEEFATLWKGFINAVTIKERTNKRCQMNFMPKKYWKYMLEMEGQE